MVYMVLWLLFCVRCAIFMTNSWHAYSDFSSSSSSYKLKMKTNLYGVVHFSIPPSLFSRFIVLAIVLCLSFLLILCTSLRNSAHKCICVKTTICIWFVLVVASFLFLFFYILLSELVCCNCVCAWNCRILWIFK